MPAPPEPGKEPRDCERCGRSTSHKSLEAFGICPFCEDAKGGDA